MIRLENISYTYPNQLDPILKDFQLLVQAGDFILITGANGAGKSTLLRIIAGLIPKFSGGHFVGTRVLENQMYDTVDSTRFGVLLSGIEQQFIQSRVDQEFFYILENRGLTMEEIDSRWEMLKEYFKLETLANREIHTLSSGEMQLVKLALAFALLPRVLLMDEPLSHLDDPTKNHVLHVLRKLKKQLGLTMIVADHDPSIWEQLGPIQRLQVNQSEPKQNIHVPFKNQRLGETLIEIDRLTYQKNGKVIISGFSGKIARGECVVVVGPNGAGKTTLLRLISGENKCDQGQIQFAVKPKIKMLTNPVHMNFFSQKIADEYALENIPMNSPQSFDISAWENRYVHDLSQGEQRKVAFNLLSHGNVELLLLDEPFLHLDGDSTSQMLQMISKQLAEGMTVIITAHEVGALRSISNQVWELS